MTRKRIGKPLSYYFQDECPMCKGTGKIKGSRAIVESIIQDIKQIVDEKDIKGVLVITKQPVKEKIDDIYYDFIKTVLEKAGKTFKVIARGREFYKDYEIILES